MHVGLDADFAEGDIIKELLCFDAYSMNFVLWVNLYSKTDCKTHPVAVAYAPAE